MPIVLFFSLNRNGGAGDNRGWFWFAFIVALLGVLTVLALHLEHTKLSQTFVKILKRLVLKMFLKF